MKSKQLSASTIQILAAVTAFAGIVFLMWISVYSADDFWYSTFLDGGLASFLELTKYHYEIFNGRVLVHLAAQLILHLGNWAFSLVGLLCCAAIPLAALRAAQRPRSQAAACLAVFGVGVLALPRELLVEGLFWRSAFCNYVLPTAMVAGELLVLVRVTGPGKTRFGAFPACVLAGFLCGATTEQSGLVAMAAAGLVGLWCLVKNRRKLAYPAVALLCSAAGLMTVFLSPATYSRFFRETKAAKLSSFFDSLQSGLESQAALFAAGRTASILLALLFLFAALALMRITEKRELPLAAGGAFHGGGAAFALSPERRADGVLRPLACAAFALGSGAYLRFKMCGGAFAFADAGLGACDAADQEPQCKSAAAGVFVCPCGSRASPVGGAVSHEAHCADCCTPGCRFGGFPFSPAFFFRLLGKLCDRPSERIGGRRGTRDGRALLLS